MRFYKTQQKLQLCSTWTSWKTNSKQERCLLPWELNQLCSELTGLLSFLASYPIPAKPGANWLVPWLSLHCFWTISRWKVELTDTWLQQGGRLCVSTQVLTQPFLGGESLGVGSWHVPAVLENCWFCRKQLLLTPSVPASVFSQAAQSKELCYAPILFRLVAEKDVCGVPSLHYWKQI